MSQLELNVVGMTCGHCVLRVENALKNVEGVSEVQVSLETNKAHVSGDPLNSDELISAIQDAGYTATL